MLKQIKSIINILCSTVFISFFVFILLFNNVSSYDESVRNIKASITARYEVFPGDDTLKVLYAHYLKFANYKFINGVVTLNDGNMIQESPSNPPLLRQRSEAVVELNSYLKNKDIPLIFIRAPGALIEDSQLPYGLEDVITISEDMSHFLSSLQDSGVEVLDLRNSIIEESIDYTRLYFKGDHHWNTYGAFYAFQKVAAYIEDKFNYTIDGNVLDVSQYDTYTNSNAFVGSLSMRVGNKREDISVLLPRFHTQFEAQCLSPHIFEEPVDTFVTGNFVEVYTPKINTDNGLTAYTQLNRFYLGHHRYTNQLAYNDVSLLLLSDSFGLALAPYLSIAYKNVDYLYLASNVGNDLLFTALEEQEYDLVLFLAYDATILLDGNDMEHDRFNLGKIPD